MTNPDEMNDPTTPSVGKCRPGDDPRQPRFCREPSSKGQATASLSDAAMRTLEVFELWLLASDSWDHSRSRSVIIEYAVWAAMGYGLSVFKPATRKTGRPRKAPDQCKRNPVPKIRRDMRIQEEVVAEAREKLQKMIDSGEIYLPDPESPNTLDAEPGES
jgi:hypothetical protein